MLSIYDFALVNNEASIDRLCLPRFDSSACFAALLGNEEQGRWPIASLSRRVPAE